MHLNLLLLLFFGFTLGSCGSVKHAPKAAARVHLNDSTFFQFKGKFKDYSIGKDSMKESLYGDVFDRGINPVNKLHYIELEPVGKSGLRVSYWDGLNRTRSRVFHGKIRGDYFIFKRKYDIFPFIVMNMFRGRAFRIGLLENGNLITDYNQLSTGTVYVLLPFVQHQKSFGVEFERIQ